MSSENSTNVCISWSERVLRAGVGALGAASPRMAAALVEHVFLRTPPRRARPPEEMALLGRGTRFAVSVGGERLAAWRWGEGPAVLLAHGWGGRGGQLRAFVAPLVDAGFQVVAHDAPGHGASPGRSASLPAFAAALAGVA